jgi:hypothetical protein
MKWVPPNETVIVLGYVILPGGKGHANRIVVGYVMREADANVGDVCNLFAGKRC